MRNACFPGASRGPPCLLSSGHPFEGQDCTPGSVAFVGSSSFGIWCTLHQVAVLLSLSGVKSEAWATTSFLISPTLSAPYPPTQSNHGNKADNALQILELQALGAWESTAINFRWHRAQSSREPFALTLQDLLTVGFTHNVCEPLPMFSPVPPCQLKPLFLSEWPSVCSPGSSSGPVLFDSILLITNPPNSSSDIFCFHLQSWFSAKMPFISQDPLSIPHKRQLWFS